MGRAFNLKASSLCLYDVYVLCIVLFVSCVFQWSAGHVLVPEGDEEDSGQDELVQVLFSPLLEVS